jgi:hypothetical protein
MNSNPLKQKENKSVNVIFENGQLVNRTIELVTVPISLS